MLRTPRPSTRRWSHVVGRAARSSSDRTHARRGERGVAIVELAIIAPLLVLVVFTAIDLGRLAQYQNRTSNAAREAAMIAQQYPGSVDSGCRGDRNVTDRAKSQEPTLAALSGYTVTYQRWNTVAGTWDTYTGCDRFSTLVPTTPPAPGDRIRVAVKVRVDMTGPATAFLLEGADGKVEVSRDIEMVVQG